MATDPTVSEAKQSDDDREIRVYSHSSLFYWWPAWFFGFVAAFITWYEDNRMAIVPPDSKLVVGAIEGADGAVAPKQIQVEYSESVKAKGKEQFEEKAKKYFKDFDADEGKLTSRMSIKPWLGPMYFLVLLLVIMITNVPLRGLWSVVVIILTIMVGLIFSIMEVWDDIFNILGGLHIHVNYPGYLFLSSILLVVWLVAVNILDRRTYISFRPGQIRVREEIFEGEAAYDATSASAEKKRDDLFRHWFLGLFSGDMTVTVRAGGQDRVLRLPNVLFIGWKLPKVQNMLRERAVV